MKIKRRNSMKKYLFTLMIAIALFLSLSLPSSAASKKSQVISANKKYMSYVKKFNTKKMESEVISWGKRVKPSDFSPYLYVRKYFKWSNKKMTYTVLSTNVSGKTAKVKMRVKYSNSENFSNTLLGLLFLELIGKDDVDDKELEKIMNRCSKIAYIDSINKKRIYKTENVTITYVENNGKWKIKKMNKKFENIIYSNYPYCAEHFFD